MEKTKVGPFLIVKKLGTNRRQKVYHARQTEQNRDVALKFISVPPTVQWNKALEKIELEVKELQKLRHPNLVQVYGAGVDEDRIFFATELIDGESLAAILSRRGKLTPDLVVEYGRQISDLLRYLNSKDLIHSKLTPEKILVTSDHKIKISDLRLNRSKRRRWDASGRRELDIAAYMAPEQFTDGATYKSDFYSLGVILYEMLTGKLPYEPDTMGRMTRMKMNAPVPSVTSHVMNCPIWLDRIITQMMSPNPRKRPHTARAIVLAFEEIKKMDATQKAAVAQVTGGFNPLTVGQDQTEARKLMGYRKSKPHHADTPFFQRIPFQIGALSVIVAIAIYFLVPPSHEKIIAKAKMMIASGDSSLWGEARSNLQPIIKAGGKHAVEAEELYYISRRQTLVLNAESGLVNRLQSENVQMFGKAVRAQKNGNMDEAIEIFADLVVNIDPDGDERHVRAESLMRLERISQREQLPSETELLSELISQSGNAFTPRQLVAAHALLAEITLEFAGVEGYSQIVADASEQLQTIKGRIANERKSELGADKSSEEKIVPSDDGE